jgi:hypothetical protein
MNVIKRFFVKKGLLKSCAQSEFGQIRYAKNSAIINTIYMHIHKCAGTSIYRDLSASPNFICCVGRPGSFPLRVGFEIIEPEIWEKSYKFTVVRNPFSRLVSVYKMFENSGYSKSIFGDFSGFIEYIRWSDVNNHIVDDYVTESSMNLTLNNVLHHCSSYHNKKYHLDDMDEIFRFETIADEILTVFNKLNITNTKLQHSRANNTYNYTNYYSKRERDIIYDKYARDIERFGYVFEQ